ncbi:hypothetical protein DSO57_1027538 [Entomophthora muscae]|uniref:Uncharacterized protein n=1 Tax=Entomophthora muscae TaxID=34485 RepID=A0ACC2RSM5_9FUNG|nr:hypothetical protein DSO57_1027538 [Entomophthora muscae]
MSLELPSMAQCVPPGCDKTVASGFIYEAIFEIIGIDILASDEHLACVTSAPSLYPVKAVSQVPGHTAIHRKNLCNKDYVPAALSR